ncbi:Lrp/AsnC family transcriptional regulator [Sphingomonas sp. BT-65]|uniref:Lrp/AsnC family transcriptional regulator n=1 Tax=Sphingomonas sp. BT-65 TaxID=2989821 RepID=UPI002236B947|nr:Lrp/AsnC family transcriptional regulator [Sphingomonas sp. BT-65]MCW4463251.1 Lrp/AsnC family transcriptional regulator [Sphingomonas sp. BT-65]
MALELDPQDRRLLSLLQDDAGIAINALADETGLSPASVQRRLRRLREGGVIAREVAVIDPLAVGLGMSFIVMVELERDRIDQLDSFRRKALREPHVQQCYYVTGEADFALVCVTRDMADFEALTRRLFFGDENVRRFRTSVVMGRTKVGLTLPIE